MKDLNNIVNDITAEKNLEINLPKFSNSMMSLYNGLAYMKLSMNYYTFYEMYNDYKKDDLLNGLVDRINKVMQNDIINSSSTENSIESAQSIDLIRNEIISIMEVVTSYTDKLAIYEYILNRAEFRFNGEELDEDYYNEYFTNDIMHYIIADKDNVVINSKISAIVGQLPVRMVKDKFYDYIRDAFSIYKGAQNGTVDDFVYAIRTVAMLDTPEHFEEYFPEVHEYLSNLSNADYKNMDKNEFDRLQSILALATDRITTAADMFVVLQQIVNDMYTVILSKMYAFSDVSEIEASKSVIEYVWNGFSGKEYNSEDDVITSAFESFEGKQERIYNSVYTNEFAIEYAVNNLSSTLDSLVLKNVFNSLNVITKLQSGSDFVVLNKDESKYDIADDSYVLDACEHLITELDNSFAGRTVVINRAVMAMVLSQLPVFFNNVDEIQQYINNSLIQCSDNAEKMAVIHLIKMIME